MINSDKSGDSGEEKEGIFPSFLTFFRFRIICSESLHGYSFHFLFVQRTVVVIGIFFRDTVYHVHSFDHLAERGVASVKMRSRLVHDEELAAAGIGMHSPCHGKYAGGMRQIVGYAVLGKLAFDRVAGTAHTGSVGASALDHETIDDAMEDQAVIEAFFYKADEIDHPRQNL